MRFLNDLEISLFGVVVTAANTGPGTLAEHLLALTELGRHICAAGCDASRLLRSSYDKPVVFRGLTTRRRCGLLPRRNSTLSAPATHQFRWHEFVTATGVSWRKQYLEQEGWQLVSEAELPIPGHQRAQ